MKCVVMSQPKAGTYLCANLLVEFGMVNSSMHLSEHEYQRYDLSDLDACRNATATFTHRKDLHKTLKMIKDNEFAVGHIRGGHKNISRMKEFKKIFLVRSKEEIFQSAERWRQLSGRDIRPKVLVNLAKEMLPWEDEEDVFVLPFKKMLYKNKECLDELQVYLFGEVRVDSVEAMTAALEKDSLTKSDIRK